MLALFSQVIYLVVRCRQGTDEADVIVDIFISPFPLVTRHLDTQIRVTGIFHIHQRLGCRNRHTHQYQERNHGPQDLYRRTLMKL